MITYLTEFFFGWEMFQKKVVEKIKTRNLYGWYAVQHNYVKKVYID